jgi:two-component system, OmpR family, sensor histidine kinase ChvG
VQGRVIGPLKSVLKRHWPALSLRTILFATLFFVAALPGIGAVFLRVYENTLVQQTEAELIAQGAVLGSAYRQLWAGGAPLPPGTAALRPEPPSIDLRTMPTLPVQADPVRPTGPPDPRAVAAARALQPIVIDAGRVTLAAIRLLDRRGCVVLGRGDIGLCYPHVPEVRAALDGQTQTVLRRRGEYQPRYALEWLSRASEIRVYHVRPVRVGGQVIGAVMLSRSPRGLFLGIYQDRGKIALGVVGIFLILLLLAGLLSRGISRPIEQLSEATRNVARGPVAIPEPPVTAAVEIRGLYENFAAMAERIERRSRYLKDFAAAVSHEFKTPIAGIRGALELLSDHGETMSGPERERFIANAMADADRLSHLLERLLAQARADMAVAAETARTSLAAPVAAVADAHRGAKLSVEIDLPGDLPPVAAPPELIEAVLETLVENSSQAGAGAVRIAARRMSGRVWLTVADDGPGVPPTDQERIFEPFQTSRRAEGGSGLGLSIARSLLASVGGTIESRTAERGALFEIMLPTAGV